MSTNGRLVALAAAFSMLVAPAFGAAAEREAQIHHRNYVDRQVYYPAPTGYYAGYYGVPYTYGWRHRSNARGWDNTCFNLPWLPSEFACSAR